MIFLMHGAGVCRAEEGKTGAVRHLNEPSLINSLSQPDTILPLVEDC